MGHNHHNHGTHNHGLHGHGVSEGAGKSGRVRLILSIVLNLIITIAEVIGGIISGSLALLSDALHNLSDTLSLAVSLFAIRISRRQPDENRTFGYKRAEIIGAFVNLIVLVVIAIWLVKESVERFLNPTPIDAKVMLIVATIGLLANLLTAFLLHRDSRSSLNIRSAYLHIVTDALSSVGVIAGGLIIWKWEWYIIDPIMCILISVYIVYHSSSMIRETVDILMNSAPADVNMDEVLQSVRKVSGVQDIHHVHLWRLSENNNALEAHIVIDEDLLPEMENIKGAIKSMLSDDFSIGHSTLEFEFKPCDEIVDLHCFDGSEI